MEDQACEEIKLHGTKPWPVYMYNGTTLCWDDKDYMHVQFTNEHCIN